MFPKAVPTLAWKVPWSRSVPSPPQITHSLLVTRAHTATKEPFRQRTPPQAQPPTGRPHWGASGESTEHGGNVWKYSRFGVGEEGYTAGQFGCEDPNLGGKWEQLTLNVL